MRYPALDTIRVVASFCVVFIHVSAYMATTGDEKSLDWWSVNIAQALLFWPVPVFFMISGFLLLGFKGERFRDFYRKRAVAIFLPALFWIIFYLIWGHYVRGHPEALSDAIPILLSGSISDHLYFLVALLGIYLFVPFFRYFFQQANGVIVLAFGLLMTLLWVADYGINKWVLDQWGRTSASLPMIFLGYFVIGYGYKLTLDLLDNKEVRWVFGSAWLLGFLLCVWIKYLEAAASAGEIPFFYANSYFGLPLFIVSVAIFPLMIRATIVARMGKYRIIKLLAGSAFGIYLVHVALLDWLHLILAVPRPESLASIVLESTILFMASVLIVLALQLSPVLSWIVGGSNLMLYRSKEIRG
jgi:surface polysaccharide O-acyltransferase-like enzyme